VAEPVATPASRGVTRWRALALALGAAALAAAITFALVASNGGGPVGVTKPTAFDLPRLDGPGRVQLAAFRGEPVVVNLYASWCPSCRSELPGLAKVAAELRGKVAFIAVDSEDTGDGLGMAHQYGLTASGFVLAHDVGGHPATGLHDALRAPGMPTTVFYDRDGKVVLRAISALPEATLRAELRRLYGVRV
jgi:thiol-disulfide isomerase/thioredoxin